MIDMSTAEEVGIVMYWLKPMAATFTMFFTGWLYRQITVTTAADDGSLRNVTKRYIVKQRIW